MNNKTNWFEKSKEDLKLVFVDCETHFSDVGAHRSTWKYKPPILRLLTWMTWDGKTIGKPITRDARFFDGDPWQDIRELLEQGYILIAYNTQFDIQPALCGGGWILPFIFKGQVLDVMTNEIVLSGYNPICRPYDKFKIDKALAEISNEDEVDEEESTDDEGELDNVGKQFRLADCAWLYCGVKLDKKWQHPDTYYNDIIDPGALEYASEDVEILAPIFFKQLELIQQQNCGDAITLKTELLATGYIYEDYGVPIDSEKLNKFRVSIHNDAEIQKKELLEIFPKVMPSRTDCMKAFKSNFQKVKGVKGLYSFNGESVAISSMSELETCIGNYYKSPHNQPNEHVIRFHNFLRNNRENLERLPNLGYHADLKQSFKKLGYILDKTDKFALSKLAVTDDVREAIKLLEYKKTIRLIQGTLNAFTYDKFLKADNTLRPKARWNASKNFRAGMGEPNILALNRSLKSILSVPAGMLALTFDFSGIELQYLLDKYRPPEALKLLDAEDQHLFCASRYFDMDYDTLLKKKHEGDKEVKRIRNLSKTTTYFGVYKSNANPKSKFISGVNKLIESIRVQLGIDITQEEAKKLILNSQKFFSTWSDTKDQVEKWIMSKYRSGHKYVTFTSDKLNFKSHFMTEYLYDAEADYINPRSLLSCMIAGNITIGTQYALNRVQEYLLSKYSPDEIRLNLYWHDSYTIFGKPEILFEEKETILEMLCKYTFEYSGMSSTFLEIAGNIYDKDDNLYNGPTDIVKTEIRIENEKEVTYYYDEFNDNWTKELEERYRYDKFGNFARLG